MSDNPLILQYSDGNLVPYQTPDPAQAAQRALDFTGIPDLVSGANALARGEWLPGLGQAAAGASVMLPLGKLAGAAKLGAELMPLGGLIKAWHGTPHLFEPVPARAIEESGITAYHATPAGFDGDFQEGTHFGTLDAAQARLENLLATPNDSRYPFHPRAGEEAPAVYRVKLKPNKVLDVPDLGEFGDSDIAAHLHEKGIITDNEIRSIYNGEIGATNVLRQKGYDALRYTNTYESPGSVSHMVLDPSIISPTHRIEPGNPFGEFRDAAVGTGEGHQTYGYGHYVAGNPSVSEEYQRRLAGSNNYSVKIGDTEYNPRWNQPSSADFVDRLDQHLRDQNPEFKQPAPSSQGSFSTGVWNATEDWLRGKLDTSLRSQFPLNNSGYDLAANHLQQHGKIEQPGSLLEVHILPDEHELLDWDTRIGEHPREVIDKLQSSGLLPNYNPMQLRGEELYSHVVGENMQKVVDSGLMGREAKDEAKRLASAALHEAGIPGIKYLDQGSRDKIADVYHNGELHKGGLDMGFYSPKDVALSSLLGRGRYTIGGDPAPDIDATIESLRKEASPGSMAGFGDEKNAKIFGNAADWLHRERGNIEIRPPSQTSNYVIFDPKNLRIVGRNGQRLEPVEEDPFK